MEPPGDFGDWFTSTASAGTDCVEVRLGRHAIQVRHSRAPEGALLEFTRMEWRAFLAGVGRGEFDIASSSS
jgi:hypothetical protein